MRVVGIVAAVVLVAGGLSACGEEDPAPASVNMDELCEVYGRGPDTRSPARQSRPGAGAGYDADTCEMIYAQRSVNDRLHRDGYADSYGQDWDDLLEAAGCPPRSQLPQDNGSDYDAELCASMRELKSLDQEYGSGSYGSEYEQLMDAADCP